MKPRCLLAAAVSCIHHARKALEAVSNLVSPRKATRRYNDKKQPVTPNSMNTSRITARDKIRRAKTTILSGGHKRSLKDIVYEDRAAFSGLRMLYASDFSGTPIQEMLAGSGHITSVLCGTRVLAFSDEIEQQMSVGQADLGFAVRAVFDTNLLSDLPKYFGGQNISTRDRVTRACSQ